MSSKVEVDGGIGVFGLLGVVFVVLKIIDVKPVGDWSWWWVTAPFWGPLVFGLCVLVVGFFVYAAVKAWSR